MVDHRETFERKEVKYRLSAVQRKLLEGAARSHLAPSPFGRSMVSSLYLDTPRCEMIARSLEKPLYKEKLRLRWYGTGSVQDAAEAFLELKKKFDGVVYKRRVGITARSVREVCSGRVPTGLEVVRADGASRAVQDQIACELLASMRRHALLVPVALIRCERMPYEEGCPSGLRITFDAALVGRMLACQEDPMPLIDADESIMEVKCNGPYPSWLVRTLGEAHALPGSFSKYGELYRLRGSGMAARAERTRHAG